MEWTETLIQIVAMNIIVKDKPSVVSVRWHQGFSCESHNIAPFFLAE